MRPARESIPAPSVAPSITDSSIAGNLGFGVNNASSGFTIGAERNDWGHDSGPADPLGDRSSGGLFNPAGVGDAVSNLVDYSPWVTIGPSLAGVQANRQARPSP